MFFIFSSRLSSSSFLFKPLIFHVPTLMVWDIPSFFSFSCLSRCRFNPSGFSWMWSVWVNKDVLCTGYQPIAEWVMWWGCHLMASWPARFLFQVSSSRWVAFTAANESHLPHFRNFWSRFSSSSLWRTNAELQGSIFACTLGRGPHRVLSSGPDEPWFFKEVLLLYPSSFLISCVMRPQAWDWHSGVPRLSKNLKFYWWEYFY